MPEYRTVHTTPTKDMYEVRPREDRRGVDLISEALPFGHLWYAGDNAADNAIGYARFHNRSHDCVIRVFDAAGAVIETHEHVGDFRGPYSAWAMTNRSNQTNETVC